MATIASITQQMGLGSGVWAGIEELENIDFRSARCRSMSPTTEGFKKITIKFNMRVYAQYRIIAKLLGIDTYLLINEALKVYLPELRDNGIANSLSLYGTAHYKKIGQYLFIDLYSRYNEVSKKAVLQHKARRGVTFQLINRAMEQYLPSLRRKDKGQDDLSIPLFD